MTKRVPFPCVALMLTALALPGPAASQETAPPPAPVEPAPLTAPAPGSPASSSPAPINPAPAPPSPAPTSPIPVSPPASTRPALVPNPGDTANADEVSLPAKPAIVLSGQSTWDDGFENLKNAFRKIEEELARAGISPAGRPIAVFTETEDKGFRYDAMIPIPSAPADRKNLSPELRFGTTPEGKHLRFMHREAYDEIDSTYEMIEAYLEAKGVTVKPVFVEEYVTDLTDSTDTNLKINVFVRPE